MRPGAIDDEKRISWPFRHLPLRHLAMRQVDRARHMRLFEKLRPADVEEYEVGLTPAQDLMHIPAIRLEGEPCSVMRGNGGRIGGGNFTHKARHGIFLSAG